MYYIGKDSGDYNSKFELLPVKEMFKDCKYLYIIDSYDKLTDHSGYLYCISTSNDSYTELYEMRDRLRDAGRLCVVGGSYNNGGAIGVQYEYKGQ